MATQYTGSSTNKRPRAADSRWILQPGGVFTPSGDVVTGVDVVVADGLIDAVVPRDSVESTGARMVHAPDATLLPGLIDSHVHLTFSADSHIVRNVIHDPVQVQLARAAGNAQRALANGVTTLMDCGGRLDVVVALRDSIDSGVILGPRLMVAGAPITTTAGHCHWLGGVADSVDDVIRVARQQVAGGVDAIKLMLTGGNLTPGSNPSRLQYPPEVLEALVRECERLGKPLIVHAHTSEAVAHCARLGIRVIAHATCVDHTGELDINEELMSELLKAGSFIDPTIMVGRSTQSGTDEVAAEKRHRQRAAMLPLFRQMHDFGVPLLAGTDAGVTGVAHGSTPGAVVALCREAGLTAGQAVCAATSVAAQALGLDHEVGEIRPGAVADLLLVDGSIETDIESVNRPIAVWKSGRLVLNHDALRQF